jgi:hypothetical protein
MSADPLQIRLQPADRVNYATGMLLDAGDFQAEQYYHRGRLARALTYLHGYGTIAGLKMELTPGTGDDEKLMVRPGIALDRLGRIVEVPTDACMRLDRWYRGQTPDRLTGGLHEMQVLKANGAPEDAIVTGVVVDVFVRFVVCERGLTPAFASGPFDALDAVVASRLRDYYELELVVREETTPPQPEQQWPELGGVTDAAARRSAANDAILGAWKDGPDTWTNEGLAPLREHAVGQDTTALLLARLTIPATDDGPGQLPRRTPGEAVVVEDKMRPFVYASGLAASFLGFLAG